MNGNAWLRRLAVVLLACWAVAAAQTETPRESASQAHPLALSQTHYRLRAGESTRIEAPRETVDFLLLAKARRVETDGKEPRGIVIGPNRAGDQILLAASLRMKPGKYSLTLSATGEMLPFRDGHSLNDRRARDEPDQEIDEQERREYLEAK